MTTFTDRSVRVIALAEQEARMFKHEYLGSEHILLGLIREESGVAANVLQHFNVGLTRVRFEVVKIVSEGPESLDPQYKLPKSPRYKRLVENASVQMSALNHTTVGTEHLLLALLQDLDSVACQVLGACGVAMGEMRDYTLRILRGENPNIYLSTETLTSLDALRQTLEHKTLEETVGFLLMFYDAISIRSS